MLQVILQYTCIHADTDIRTSSYTIYIHSTLIERFPRTPHRTKMISKMWGNVIALRKTSSPCVLPRGREYRGRHGKIDFKNMRKYFLTWDLYLDFYFDYTYYQVTDITEDVMAKLISRTWENIFDLDFSWIMQRLPSTPCRAKLVSRIWEDIIDVRKNHWLYGFININRWQRLPRTLCRAK